MSRIHDALKQIDMTREAEIATSSMPALRELDSVSSIPSVLSTAHEKSWTFDPKTALSFDDPAPKASEEFRSLRMRLQRIREKQTLRSVVVTSAQSGEGKSFIAFNLSRVLALQSSSRILLIDGDLRGRQQHKSFGVEANPGLSEYLLGEAEEHEILQRGQADNLFLIPAGRKVGGTAELIANGRFRMFVSRLTALFEWVIVDSPAATSFSDTCLLGNCCDGILMVVRSHVTPVDDVRRALDRFPETSYLGIVLNEIQEVTNEVLRHPRV
jgi:capsular exopolysaccharide synthesis family protein